MGDGGSYSAPGGRAHALPVLHRPDAAGHDGGSVGAQQFGIEDDHRPASGVCGVSLNHGYSSDHLAEVLPVIVHSVQEVS